MTFPAPRRRSCERAPRQRGAALITALLVVTLAAVLVSGLLWREQVQIRRVENQRQSQQARWVSRGVFAWARLILRSEADSAPVTYLGGVWSVPIAETRLSSFLGRFGEARAEQGASTWLSGTIEDAQAKFNLRDLVTAGGVSGFDVDPVSLGEFRKLLEELGIDSQLATPVAQRIRQSLMRSVTRGQRADSGNPVSDAMAGAQNGSGRTGGGFTDDPGLAGSDDGAGEQPIQMHDVDALLDVPGFTPAAIAQLAPFVTVLPVPSQINLNTAPAEVIAARVPLLSLAQAQVFVQNRKQIFVINLADAQTRLERMAPDLGGLDPARFDITSNFFLIHSRVRHENAVVDRVALVYRNPRTHQTHVMQVRDVPSAE
ncbi:type II secretion system minor pseudopilin GspK [Robbsia sp. Bb-Pol-6]|uniref:Type II secretion system minor pseudopilin GspK n=1 Tax=Robbsia betulipollinis TaxID=2981849 RepID=A0ABT3ZRK3_9BURK|nr:type II secretion system minor pseudopilin GspK [Robbsia betulipollinis]MCY0389189.1 type II secretion system minor pseudopilin GspK [Robbsia betulipollinis]